MKKTFIMLIMCITFLKNIYACELKSEFTSENEVYREYIVNEDESVDFFNKVDNKIIINNNEYIKKDYNVSVENIESIIQVTDNMEIITQTNIIEDILNEFPQEIEYNEDGFIGKCLLDIENLKIQELYNGYHEEYIDEVIHYSDLSRNDMDFIPKEIEKEGYILSLINVEWRNQTTKYTGTFEIADLYEATALYRGIKRVDEPVTYKVFANYKGDAKKNIEKKYIYNIKYEKLKSDIVDDIKEKNIAIPCVVTSTSVVIVIIFLYRRLNRIKIYELDKGTWLYVGSVKLKNNVLNLSKLDLAINSKVKIKISNRVFEKIRGKEISIFKNNTLSRVRIENNEFEI